jgi:hypothetical protein
MAHSARMRVDKGERRLKLSRILLLALPTRPNASRTGFAGAAACPGGKSPRRVSSPPSNVCLSLIQQYEGRISPR